MHNIFHSFSVMGPNSFMYNFRTYICNQRRFYCSVKTQNAVRPHHEPFRLYPWKNLMEFSNFLLNSTLYERDGLVILNKPYGVGTSSPRVSDGSYTLPQAMPHIAKSLGYDSLTVLKAPEKFNSGVTILSANDAVTRKVASSQRRSKPKKQLTESYWAVCVGIPTDKSSAKKFGITLKSSQATGRKYPLLLSEWSKRSVERGDVKQATVGHRTMGVSPDGLASLVEVETSTTRWHFLRVYLAHLLSPALGDNLYAGRVGVIAGVPVLVDPASDVAASPQKLSDQLLAYLSLRDEIPTHIHLHRQTLIDFNNGSDLIIDAPVPKYFQVTCSDLGLVLPT